MHWDTTDLGSLVGCTPNGPQEAEAGRTPRRAVVGPRACPPLCLHTAQVGPSSPERHGHQLAQSKGVGLSSPGLPGTSNDPEILHLLKAVLFYSTRLRIIIEPHDRLAEIAFPEDVHKESRLEGSSGL